MNRENEMIKKEMIQNKARQNKARQKKTSPTKSAASHARGFTVLELLVTLAIIGTLVVMSMRLGRSTVQKASMTAAMNDFVADYNYARQLASRENRYVAFDFDDAGTSYTLRVQRRIGLDLTQEDSYVDHKTVSPMDGSPCFSGATDFALNSMGVIRAYPVDPNASPITVTMTFFRGKEGDYSGEKPADYEKNITLFASGGIKIEDAN